MTPVSRRRPAAFRFWPMKVDFSANEDRLHLQIDMLPSRCDLKNI